ncbi:MAG: hypothetical protein LBU09_00290 [Endomicrobium sp.]|jgi:hypothetical protein|nr:hypothetical protein [Endomicrobium sp.]
MNKIRAFINERRLYILSFAALFFLIFLTYNHTAKFGFIGLDDTSIIANKTADADSFIKTKFFLTQPVFDETDSLFYRPFLTLSFAIDSLISGGEMGFYHFSNVLIHTAAVFLLLILLRSLNYSMPISLAASLIFSVYPVLTSAIAWAPGRNDSLLAVFIFPCFIFFIKNVQTGKILYAVLTAVFLTFSAFTKETAVIMPAAFLFYVFLWHKPDKKNIITVFIVSALSFLAYCLLRSHAISQGSGILDIAKMAMNVFNSLGVYFWFSAVAFFLKKIYLYPNNLSIGTFDIAIGLIPFTAAAAAAYTFRKKINFKHIFFGLGWYFLFLTPTIVTKTGTYFNHRLYLPIVGIFIIFIEIFIVFPPKIKKVFPALAAAIIILFAFVSYKHSFYYKDSPSFWLNAYRQNPLSPAAAYEAAMHYKSLGDDENAEKLLLKALDIDKNGPSTKLLIQSGDFYFYKKQDDKAFDYYDKAQKKNKYNEYIYLGLSRHYEILHDKEKALAELERGLGIIPKSKLLAKRVKILKEEMPDDSYVIIMKAD